MSRPNSIQKKGLAPEFDSDDKSPYPPGRISSAAYGLLSRISELGFEAGDMLQNIVVGRPFHLLKEVPYCAACGQREALIQHPFFETWGAGAGCRCVGCAFGRNAVWPTLPCVWVPTFEEFLLVNDAIAIRVEQCLH